MAVRLGKTVGGCLAQREYRGFVCHFEILETPLTLKDIAFKHHCVSDVIYITPVMRGGVGLSKSAGLVRILSLA